MKRTSEYSARSKSEQNMRNEAYSAHCSCVVTEPLYSSMRSQPLDFHEVSDWRASCSHCLCFVA